MNLKSNIFHFKWLLIIGGILEVYYSLSTSITFVKQIEHGFAEYQAQALTLQAAVVGLTRELIPAKTGFMLAFLSPIIGLFEYRKIQHSRVPDIEKGRVLITSRFKSLTIISPVLVILGLFISIPTAYVLSNFQSSSDILSTKDVATSILKGCFFGIAIATLGIICLIPPQVTA